MTKSVAPIAINVNFDSLNEAYGFPPGFRDPSFFQGMDRLFQIAGRHNAPLSIFIIGRDLENPEVFARVRDWAQSGHEIGNHGWLHPVNLGRLGPVRIRDEISRAHDLIAKCTDKEPTGFIAPAWSTSRTVVDTLIDLNYVYDTSVFPSLLIYPAIIKNFFHHLLDKPGEAKNILHRADWLGPLFRPTRPFFAGKGFRILGSREKESILILPLPTVNRMMPCIWHTVGFMLGWKFLGDQLERLLHSHDGFYYLLHPADFMGVEDQDKRYQHALYRMNMPLENKLRYLEDVFIQLDQSDRPIMTMHDLACHHYQKAGAGLEENEND